MIEKTISAKIFLQLSHIVKQLIKARMVDLGIFINKLVTTQHNIRIRSIS